MVNQQKVIEILRNIGETIEKEKLFLTELDNVIGDGDHGINLSRGFQEVEKKLDTLADKDIGTILKLKCEANPQPVKRRCWMQWCRRLLQWKVLLKL